MQKPSCHWLNFYEKDIDFSSFPSENEHFMSVDDCIYTLPTQLFISKSEECRNVIIKAWKGNQHPLLYSALCGDEYCIGSMTGACAMYKNGHLVACMQDEDDNSMTILNTRVHDIKTGRDEMKERK